MPFKQRKRPVRTGRGAALPRTSRPRGPSDVFEPTSCPHSILCGNADHHRNPLRRR